MSRRARSTRSRRIGITIGAVTSAAALGMLASAPAQAYASGYIESYRSTKGGYGINCDTREIYRDGW
ncbi:hypothetical protein ABZ070_27070 [Streptomyces sp. NPDC006283]|uniref:hypothetical protein n=1 Tax=Streptomyces sp. NPDC006283 TaxID=3156741 RepID=UPI0033B192E5